MTYAESVRAYFKSHYALLEKLEGLTTNGKRTRLLARPGNDAAIIEMMKHWQAFVTATFGPTSEAQFAKSFATVSARVCTNLATNNPLDTRIISGAKKGCTNAKNKLDAKEIAITFDPTNPDWQKTRLLAVEVWGNVNLDDF